MAITNELCLNVLKVVREEQVTGRELMTKFNLQAGQLKDIVAFNFHQIISVDGDLSNEEIADAYLYIAEGSAKVADILINEMEAEEEAARSMAALAVKPAVNLAPL